MSKNENDKFLIINTNTMPSSPKKCNLKWWNQGYQHQQFISQLIESSHFRIFIIVLIILDTSLLIGEIMLDSFKIQNECEMYIEHKIQDYQELIKERLELLMEIAHYLSIVILSFFVLELLVRVYVSGGEFWNFRRRKMQYFDALIVITSLIIDLYFLRSEKKILSHKLLIFSFRLWRFVRIISSVAELVRDEEFKHKNNLNKQYLAAVHRLVDLHLYKTRSIENNENLNFTVARFRIIDTHCQASLNTLEENRELTSSAVVTQFTEGLYDLENKADQRITQLTFMKSSDV